MNCPRCQQALIEDARFCSGCGLSTAEINMQTQASEQQDTLKYSPDPLIGQVLDSKYQLVGRLGEGGMGTVYCAHRLHIGDEVAIKVLHPQFVRDAKAIERFRREARSAAMIGHANVVTIHDFNEAKAEGAPAYIVMELVRGRSLRDLLRQEGRLAPARVVALMEQICAGVGAAHRQGIVHRDLKPDNVIVQSVENGSNHETVKVLDFGLAKLRDMAAESSLTQTGAMLGTPSYMSPEQCRGESLDPRSDVYSLGAMLYEMLTGVRPFLASTVVGLVAKHLNDVPPTFPKELKISPALEAVCRRALSKNPDERQTDATSFSRELQSALASPDISEPLVTAPGPSRQHKFNTLKWAVVGTLSILLFTVITAIAIRYKLIGSNSNIANASESNAIGGNSTEDVNATSKTQADNASPLAAGQGLIGTWTGTYGVLNQPATLLVKNQKGSNWSGVLEQGGVRVAFIGNVDESSRKITFKETRILAGSGWSLGENEGELSADRRKMSGTGKDAAGAQLGMSYQWSFSKQ